MNVYRYRAEARVDAHMQHARLGVAERAIMLALHGQRTDVRNPDLARLAPRLTPVRRRKLNDLGLIRSRIDRGTFVHRLTDAGLAWCAAELRWQLPPEPPNVRTAIVDAYARLAARPGGWVRVVELREALPDVGSEELDPALVLLGREPGISLIQQENRRLLTDADRAGAVRVGSQWCHLLAVEEA